MHQRSAGWGRLLPLIVAVWIGGRVPGAVAQAAPPNGCVTCHQKLEDSVLAAPARTYKDDVHANKGFGCVDCHGGDATKADKSAKAPGTGFIGRPAGRKVLEVCGRCHASADFMRRYNPSLRVDQVTEYATSVHGQRLMKLGDPKVATCVSCHPAHRILPPGDSRSSVNAVNVAATCGACHADSAYMKSYGIPTDQLANYEKSVHWKALSEGGDRSAPTCNDCHGNHGAAPPGVGSVGNVCGQCHSVMAQYFGRSRHAEIFATMGLPGCASCHSNHDVVAPGDTALGIAEGSFCGRCHSEGEDGATMALTMRASIDSLRHGIFVADSLLGLAEHAGMEVSQPQFELESAGSSLLQAKASIHTFVTDSVTAHTEEGWKIVTAAVAKGHAALGDLRFRRVGLSVSTGIILVLILGLLLKIRQIDTAAASSPTTPTAPGGRA